jgi:drug/metabolite transporter (DMT)-like permease
VPHFLGALLGFAGVVLLAFGRGLDFAGGYALGYALALGCAFTWSLYSVLSRRFGETPTDAIAAFCTVAALLSLACHLLFEHTVWPASPAAWLAVLALGIGPTGGAFYLWDHAVKRGDIRALGAFSYATPILSTALLILCGLAPPTGALLIAALLVTVGAVLASRDLWKR